MADSIEIIVDKDDLNRFGLLSGKLRVALFKGVQSAAIGLSSYIKSGKLSGQILNVRTGTLRRSITAQTEDRGNEIVGQVGTNVKYAKFHEFGTRKLPERSFLRSGLADRAPNIKEAIEKAIKEATA
jgi:HK97 gp10 family phage protein